MLPIKAAFAAAFFAGLAEWVGHVPAAIIDAAAVTAGVAYLITRVLLPAGRLFRKALQAFDLLEHLPTILDRLEQLERTAGEIREPVEAVKRELGVTARGDTPHPHPDS